MLMGRPMSEICHELAAAASDANDEILAQLLRMAALRAATADLLFNEEDSAIKDLLVGAWDWDVVKNLVYTDGRFARMFGVTAEQAAKGMPLKVWLDAIHPDDVAPVTADIEQALRGRLFSREYRVLCNGQTYWVYARGKGTLDEHGTCVRFPGAIVDITREKLEDCNFSIAPL
jgi:PAS domain S-box-containing protein